MHRAPSAARRRSILFVLLAVGAFSVTAVQVKALGGTIPLAELILFRNLFTLPALLPLAWRRGGWAALRTTNPSGHAARIAFGLVGMAGVFHGYATLPLATVTALGFTMPLFMAVLAVPLAGERLDAGRALAAGAGFVGVLLMTQPFGSAGSAPTDAGGVAAVLAGALGWALAMLAIRRMGQAGEPGVTIVLWFALGAAVVGALFSIPVWVTPAPWQWALLAGIGLVSAVGQLLMTQAYRGAPATLLAPFEYSAILWTTLAGALLWGERPDLGDLAGVLVLIGSGLLLWRQEAKAAA